jgi:chemotaxis signal transduction protein
MKRHDEQDHRFDDRDDHEHEEGEIIGRPVPDDAVPVTVDNYLFFSVSGLNLCVRLTQIVAIVNVGDTLLDMDFGFELPALCKGFVKYQRQQIPLLDLRPKFGYPYADIPEGAIALLIDFGVTYLALMVDFVYSLEQGTAAHILPIPLNISDLGDDFLKGYLEYPRGGAFLLDALSLFSDEEIEALAQVI